MNIIRRKRVLGTLFIITFVVAGLLIILYAEKIFCVYTDIDILSGDVRQQRYICFVKVSEKVEQTEFSKYVKEMIQDLKLQSDWKRVSTTGTLLKKVFVYSKWHGAINDCQTMIDYIKSKESKEEQIFLLKKCLECLKNGQTENIIKLLDA